MDPPAKYQRILLKLSGEAISGPGSFGIDPPSIEQLTDEIKKVVKMGVQLGVVIGGGNIVRGEMFSNREGMERVSADYMGMLATVINALALQGFLERKGLHTRVLTAIRMEQLAEPYIRRRALRHMEKGRIVIFAGGTGNPYLTTDTAAVLRAIEIEAEVLLKGTKVEGVYTKDPQVHSDAEFISEISYMDVLKKGLRIMDSTAITLCMDNKIPLIIFNIQKKDGIARIIKGERIGTIIKE
ncbi:MAG: UMP kinase [Candidatus Glassbacteria bacterium]